MNQQPLIAYNLAGQPARHATEPCVRLRARRPGSGTQRTPALVFRSANATEPAASCFAGDDSEDTAARPRGHSAELVGGIVRFEGVYLLCYIRGPEGIVVGLAEQLD